MIMIYLIIAWFILSALITPLIGYGLARIGTDI